MVKGHSEGPWDHMIGGIRTTMVELEGMKPLDLTIFSLVVLNEDETVVEAWVRQEFFTEDLKDMTFDIYSFILDEMVAKLEEYLEANP